MTKNRRHDIVKPSKFKTSMCTFFLSAEGCPFGDKCAFAHGEDELRCEPPDSAARAAGQSDGAAATSSPTSSHDSDQGEARGAGERPNGSKSHVHHDVTAPISNTAPAKRKARKSKSEVSAVAASMHGVPGGKSDATQLRCRPQRDRRTLPPPPPMQSQGPMPSAAYNLSVTPAQPSAYALYGDLSMAYGGLPAMSGMPYYIPTVGNHPFSVINNNHHAINVVPHMQSPMVYPTSAPPPLSFPPPPPPPQPTPAPQTSVPNSPYPSSSQRRGTAETLTGGISTSSAEEAKRRPRQPQRHVVSSNTMAHTHGRHSANTSAAPPAEVASPQYVYGLMAAAGAAMSGASTPAAATPAAAQTEAHGGGPVVAAAPPHSQQPRLIVVPHKSGSGGFVVPSNIKNYHPNTTVEPTSGYASQLHSPVLGTSENTPHATAATARMSASRVDTPPSATARTDRDNVAEPPSAFQQPKFAPSPPTIVHIPLTHNNFADGAGSGRDGGNGSGVGGKTVGDALWGPAGGSVNPLAASTQPATAAEDSSRDYNALLSGLGIGGSSYTAIPLDELVRQRGPARDNDDDGAFGSDFDWTGALERWLHTAKEESAATAKAASTVAAAAPPPAAAPPASIAAHLPQVSQPVTSALNHRPVLMEIDPKSKTRTTTTTATTTTALESKRKPAVVCQVSRAGGASAPPRRRAPVMTNQFKSSCAAEAESGSVLLYCAEKNTLVYITSSNAAATTAAAAANAQASRMGSAASNGESDGTGEGGGHAGAALSDSPPTVCGAVDLGLGVRFNPGRKKHSVLEPEAGDNDAEYCI